MSDRNKHENSEKSKTDLINDIVQLSQSKDVIIAVTGRVGSGTSWILGQIQAQLKNINTDIKTFIIKASDCIKELSPLKNIVEDLDKITDLQNEGDKLRKERGNNILAIAMMRKMKLRREELLKEKNDNKGTIYLFDSLKHPDEVKLLRSVYGDGFWLLGVLCQKNVREERLTKKHQKADKNKINDIMTRDEKDSKNKHGQQVAKTFELSDYFIDNSKDEEFPTREIKRFLNMVLESPHILRPTDVERGMFHAYAARHGSACLSRQVGASLMDWEGNVLSKGCNDAPKAGGGLYGQGTNGSSDFEYGRCYKLNGYCSNERTRNEIMKEILTNLGLETEPEERKKELIENLRKSSIGDILEFSRSVHAEMDALLSAARIGQSTVGTRLFVTTFPCHNCARHIVVSGVDEVHYIEPYFKSRAIELHRDAIIEPSEEDAENWVPPSQEKRKSAKKRVMFRPYVGTAPRLYQRAFLQNREMKDKDGNYDDDNRDEILHNRPFPNGYRILEKSIIDKILPD